MDLDTYLDFHSLLSDLDYWFLLSTIPLIDGELDMAQAANTWDGMNLIVSSVGTAMTAMDQQENFHNYDGYRPYYLNLEGEFEMQGNMSNYLIMR